MARIVDKEQRMFITGNEVVAWGALAAGADIMYGYPITPQNELMHHWTRLAPLFGKAFLQTEDELSAGFATIGGVLAGKKAFSGTSGPGNVLMQEPISMAEMMRIPAVWIIQQRGGPSTATVIYSQQETRLTCFGGNGEGLRIVYSTASHQELFDYTIKAFNAAWRYRFPAFVLGDGYQAKMREAVTLYNPEEGGLELVPSEALVLKPGLPGRDRPPAHHRNTFNIEEELLEVLEQHIGDYEGLAPQIAEWEEVGTEGSQVTLVAHGIVARAAREARDALAQQGFPVGYFRPITLRPFPTAALRQAAEKSSCLLVLESAYGQLVSLVKEALYGLAVPLCTLLRPGVGITAEEVQEKARTLLTGKE
ncbi:MAG TPA: ferredoxin oxidoreductase [Firmicutes bacterium]|nr:ferredoxin oxidoreductase [Bacillota bacterium]